jgi:guanylate kinase
MQRGHLFVLSGPAGAGKTTLITRLTAEFDHVVESISSTTRPPRPGEKEGEHYHFLSRDEFEKRLHRKEFLEHAEVYGNLYGTSRAQVEHLLSQGLHVFLVIDTQGAAQVRNKVECTTLFLSPPSMDELRRRLAGRRTESREAIDRRLRWAEHELRQVKHYDYHIVNEEVEEAYDQLRSIVIAAQQRVRNPDEKRNKKS